MAHPAMDALRIKQRLIEFYKTPSGNGYAAGLGEIARGRVPGEFLPAILAETEGDGSRIASTMAKRLEFAATYWTDRDMVDLVTHAASSRPLDAITIEDAPTQHGFVLFDRPAYIRFAEDTGEFTTLNIKAMLWDQTVNVNGNPGFQVTLWSDPRDREDSLNEILKANKVDPFAGSGNLVVAHVGFIPFRTTFYDHLWWLAFAATFWHLVTQPSTTASTVVEPDRQVKKQFERAEILANTVAIITLRRTTAQPKETVGPTAPSGRTQMVRTMVGEKTGGFWRNQYYPSLDLRKPLWIMPFVRGPEDAPWSFKKEKIYAWRR